MSHQPVLHFSLARSLWLAVLCLSSCYHVVSFHLAISPALFCRACPCLGCERRPGCLDLGDPALPTADLGESCSQAPEGKSSLVGTGDVRYRCSRCKFNLQYQRAKVCFAKHCPRQRTAPWPGAAGRAAFSPGQR